jgi:2-methylisocitrate lyase-like PEP mutase family enzyme
MTPTPPATPTVDDRTKRRRLRELVRGGRLVVAPGAHDGLTARLIERAGFPAVYMTGSGVANTLLGAPDVGLVTLSEMTWVARCIASATALPVVADADTGYGNAINVRRTVREYERSGVAAIHLEDQVSPKRCGHIAGKELIPAEEMVGKIRAAVEARTDPDFLLIARTDARGPAGLDEAIRRALLYAEAGADMVFPDALLSEEELARFAAAVPHPKMMNMGGYAATRTTPKLPLATVERLGFDLVIFPLAVIRAGVRAMVDFLAGLAAGGTAFEVEHIAGLRGHPVENWYEFSGIGEIRRLEERYLPASVVEQKYAGGQGYRPGRPGGEGPAA